MISSATRGAGGSALGAHLANPDHNERVEIQQSRGLLSESIREQIDELTGLADHARTRRPLYHVHLDPPANKPLSPNERARYWEKFESEFGLSDRPYSSVIHEKHGREHEHRVYLAVKPDGRAVKFDHDFARREKLNRIFELERGEPLTIGRHNRAVANALEREGRDDLAQRIQESGITDAPRPQAISPDERHQQERTGIQKNDVAQQVLTAWQASDDGKSFANALNENGLTLAHGQKCAVVIDGTGNTHALGRLLNLATKEAGIDRIPAPAIVERIATAEIPTVSTYQDFRAQHATATTEKPQPNIAKTGATKPATVSVKSSALHDLSDLSQAIHGQFSEQKSAEILSRRDRRGLSASSYSAIESAVNSEKSLALLHQLTEPSQSETSTTAQLLDLILAQSAVLNRIENALTVLNSKIEKSKTR